MAKGLLLAPSTVGFQMAERKALDVIRVHGQDLLSVSVLKKKKKTGRNVIKEQVHFSLCKPPFISVVCSMYR